MNAGRHSWTPAGMLLPVLTLILAGTSHYADATLTNDSITLFGVVRDGVKVGEQDNLPVLDESVAPPSGTPWTWVASGMTGFLAAPTVTFTYGDDGVGQPNELHTEAYLNWNGFQDTDWALGRAGHFTLTLSNGIDPDMSYTVNLALRSIHSIDFTVIQGQTLAGVDSICADPPSGATYSWTASGVSGFSPTPAVNFAFDAEDTSHKDGRILVSYAGDCANANGTLTLSLQDGSRPVSVFDGSRPGAGASRPHLSLRSLIGDGYTVIKGQTSSGDGVSAAGAEGFTFMSSGFSGFAPAPTLSFDAMGTVVSCACPNWAQDGAFTLTVSDGFRPESVFAGRALSLRELVGDGYTAFRQQTSGGPGVNAAGANGFTFTPSGFSGFAPAPTLSFDAMGTVVSCACPNWAQDGAFTLTVSDGFRPESVFAGRALSLRELVGDGYAVFGQQTSGGPGVNAAGANGFTFTPTGLHGFATPPTGLAFDAMGAVVDCVCANWEQDGAFTLTVSDGSRPESVFAGRALSLRSLVPDPLTIPDNGHAGSINLQVQSDVGPWDWTDYEDGLANSVLMATDSFGSSSLAINWAAGAVESGESGTGTVTIQRSDGSSPESTVSLETTVVEAPQLPVSCWPVLAVMLVVVTATLMRRHVDSRERPR